MGATQQGGEGGGSCARLVGVFQKRLDVAVLPEQRCRGHGADALDAGHIVRGVAHQSLYSQWHGDQLQGIAITLIDPTEVMKPAVTTCVARGGTALTEDVTVMVTKGLAPTSTTPEGMEPTGAGGIDPRV